MSRDVFRMDRPPYVDRERQVVGRVEQLVFFEQSGSGMLRGDDSEPLIWKGRSS